jgi:hypothetical protein
MGFPIEPEIATSYQEYRAARVLEEEKLGEKWERKFDKIARQLGPCTRTRARTHVFTLCIELRP